MNRPKKENYYIDYIDTEPFKNSYVGKYITKLDKYCDELEASIKYILHEIPNCTELYIKQESELKKLKEDYDKIMKALDKACEELEHMDYIAFKGYKKTHSKEAWKEWVLSDDE